MRWYPDRIPDWITRIYPRYQWHGDRSMPIVHLTFDDGPTPVITDFVLDQLKLAGFTATFFLIGDRVKKYPLLKQRIVDNGHSIGNHTHNHLNAWQVDAKSYVENTAFAKAEIDSTLFRPPYGKITSKVSRRLRSQGYQIIMWDVLSGDFDRSRTVADCLHRLKKATRNGSIIVFHDSEKAFPILNKLLPEYLMWLKEKGFTSQAL